MISVLITMNLKLILVAPANCFVEISSDQFSTDPAHVRYVNTYRELEHFLIHFLICSYLLNYHVNPTQVLGCLAVRIARIWVTSQIIRH